MPRKSRAKKANLPGDQTKELIEEKAIFITYYWDEANRLIRPYPGLDGTTEILDPLSTDVLFYVPMVGQSVNVTLMQPNIVDYPPPTVIVSGKVTAITRKDNKHYDVVLSREGQSGLSYYDLCAMINMPVIGYHPL